MEVAADGQLGAQSHDAGSAEVEMAPDVRFAGGGAGGNGPGTGGDTVGTGGASGNGGAPDSGLESCVFNGTTYRPGQSFTLNCIIFTCQSGGTFTGGGSACPDVGTAGTTGTGGTGSGGASGTGGGGRTGSCSGTTLIASEAHDYAFSSTLTFPPVKVAPKSDLSFDWSGVSKEFLGHALDTKKDLNIILVLMFKLTLNDLQTKLNADDIKQSYLVTLPLQYATDGSGTSAKLHTFTNSGNPSASEILAYLDPAQYSPASYTYTLMAATGRTLGVGTKMIQFFQVDPNSTNTSVALTSSSTQLTYNVSLHSLTPAAIPAGQAAITLDYNQIATNALGNQFIASNITKVLVGHYDETPTELEAKFLDLELIAKKLYRGDSDSRSANPIDLSDNKVALSALKTDAGEAFSGIDDTGTWLVALQCGGCRNPAPWYLSVLKVCTP